MYTRNYYGEGQDRLNLPDNYDGTAFMERQTVSEPDVQEVSFNEKKEVFTEDRSEPCGGKFSQGFGGIPILSGLFDKGGLLGSLGLSLPNIGTEEILILATAAFLFFSKSGDRECALLLLLLIFIN